MYQLSEEDFDELENMLCETVIPVVRQILVVTVVVSFLLGVAITYIFMR